MSGWLSLANGKRVALHDGFVLGRVAGCDLVIDDTKASRRHAQMHVQGGVVEIEDLQSSNGTLLNEKPVTRRMLREGDRVQIGKTVIVFHEGELPGAAPAAAKSAAAALDDNDLFGDAPATSIQAPPPPAAAPRAAPTPVARTPAPPPPPPPPSAPPSPPPAAPAPQVVEFADEVVEVRRPPPSASPAPATRPAGGAPGVAATGPRVLQFAKHASRDGVLGDDLGQVSAARRALLIVGVLAFGVGIAFVVARLTS